MTDPDKDLFDGSLHGTVARVVFENRESGWAVVHFEADQAAAGSVPLTVVNELTQIAGVVTESEFVEKIIQCGVRQQPDSAPVQA